MASLENDCEVNYAELLSRARKALKRVPAARSLQGEVKSVFTHEVINLNECLIVNVSYEKRRQTAVPGRLPSPAFRPLSCDPVYIIAR